MLVYHGSAVGQGMTLYHNGMMVRNVTSKDSLVEFQPGEGRMIIGKLEANKDNKYASIEVDDLTMWNRTLTWPAIQDLSELYSHPKTIQCIDNSRKSHWSPYFIRMYKNGLCSSTVKYIKSSYHSHKFIVSFM